MTTTQPEIRGEPARTGRVALVTGGGGGLGEAICRTLDAAGMQVVVADVRGDMADAVAAACTFDAHAMRVDVMDAASAERAVRDTIDRYGRIDVLVNNAGVDVTAPVEEMSVEDWDRIMAVNLRGPFIMSRLALATMRERRSGHIVNIVSTAAKRAWANASAYHASKWGLLGLSHALHVEARVCGVKVTAVVAGGMRTPFLLDRFPDIDLETLQDPRNVADTVKYVISQPEGTVIPEVMVLPMRESSWP
jgi:NAD(P)-dependent dehydrogenase (short-subunit alcohol dehydrogenase family)